MDEPSALLACGGLQRQEGVDYYILVHDDDYDYFGGGTNAWIWYHCCLFAGT